MEWVETTGRTIEEAKDLALDRLGVHADEAEFEVVEEPKTGLFGRLKAEARVRARVRPSTPRPKVGRRERTRGGRSKGGQGRSRGGGQDRGGKGSKGKDGARREDSGGAAARSGEGGPKGESGGDGARGRSAKAGGSGRGGGAGSDGDGRRSGGERPRSSETTHEGRDRSGARDESTRREKDAVREELTLSEQAGVVEEFLAGLFDALDIDAEISVSELDEDTAVVSAEGDDVGLVIGPRGRTLDAVQQLARTVVQRHTAAGTKGRVRVDVGGYAERRRAALEAFARETAASVIESGTARALEPMNAADRKVVHDAVVDMDGVRTLSEGEDPRRRVVIVPADGG